MATSGRSVGVYGGAFDPPHLGHVIVACEAAWQLGLDEVRLVPVGLPVHREAPQAPAEARVAMLHAAVADRPNLAVSTVEVDRRAPSFTVDTLRGIVAAEPDLALTLIIGADQVLAFDTWREPAAITALARLGVVARADTDIAAVATAADALAPGRAGVIAMPRIDISSTLIRDRLAARRPVDHLLPPGVGDIIHSAGLYTATSAIP